MASLKDVANRAGVSVATASRVATGSTFVRPETRERVENAMRELLYVPPGRAPDSGAIGLLVPEFGNPVFAALAQPCLHKCDFVRLRRIDAPSQVND